MNTSNFTSIGMDVSDTSAHVCVMNRNGISEEFVVVLEEQALLKRLPFVGADAGVIVMETGTRAAWLKRLLTKAGWRVIVADSRKLKAISGQAIKTDTRDARILARFGMVDEAMPSTERLLSDTWVRPIEHQAIFDQLALRDQLVRQRGDLIRRVRSMVKMRGDKLPNCSTRSFQNWLPTLAPELRTLVLPAFSVIVALTQSIDTLEDSLEKQLKAIPAARRMLTVSGAGELTVMAFYAVVGDPTRFADSRDIGPYLGLTPRIDQSGQMNPRLGISKCGNSLTRRLLVQCANHILGPKGKACALRTWGLMKTEQQGKKSSKKVRIAVARKLAVMLLAIWKNDDSTWQPFPGAASEAEIPSAPVGSDDCVAAFVPNKHAITEIAASQTDPIQPCSHRKVTTDESAECRRDPAPVAAKAKSRKVAPKAPRKVPRQAEPKVHPKMPTTASPGTSAASRHASAATAAARSSSAPSGSRARTVPEEDILRQELR